MSDAKASVIVLVWNGMGYVKPCLDSVLAQDLTDFEVIVVDNGSSDGSADFVAQHYPGVRLIRNERNVGFAAGNNVGLEAASGDVLVLLNQDTEVQPGWLTALTEALHTSSDTGIVGGKALYPDGTLQNAGGCVNERGEGSHRRAHQPDGAQFDQTEEVDYVTGASLAITRNALETIGMLDAGFTPAYYEDVDWCYRARKAGYGVLFAPLAVLTHKEVSTAAGSSHEAMHLQQRNRLRFVLKHWPLERLVQEFLPAERIWLEGLDEGGERLIAATHQAYLVHLLNLADIVIWRERLMGAPTDEADTLADVLLSLRTAVPLRPAGFGPRAESAPQDPLGTEQPVRQGAAWANHIPQTVIPEDLLQRSIIREVPFHSDIPVLGAVITAFRGAWNRVSTKHYVGPMMQQQNEFNATAVHSLGRLADVLSTYIAESGREIAQLASEIQRLSARLDERADD